MAAAGDPITVALFGASGRTGQAFVHAGTAQGLMIRASLRAVNGANPCPMVETRRGDLRDADHVRDTIAGTMAVCCVFGPRPPHSDVFCARATELIVDAMRHVGVRRLVCLTGAMVGADIPNCTLPLRLMARMFRRQRPAVAADRMKQEQLVTESNLEWTLVKPPRLADGPAQGRLVAGVGLQIGLWSQVSRADLASFLVEECVAPRYVKQTVYVTG